MNEKLIDQEYIEDEGLGMGNSPLDPTTDMKENPSALGTEFKIN